MEVSNHNLSLVEAYLKRIEPDHGKWPGSFWNEVEEYLLPQLVSANASVYFGKDSLCSPTQLRLAAKVRACNTAYGVAYHYSEFLLGHENKLKLLEDDTKAIKNNLMRHVCRLATQRRAHGLGYVTKPPTAVTQRQARQP